MKTHLELAKLFKEIDQWDTIGTDTQYRILEYPDEVVIIFCPSNSKADWKINFAFPKKPYKQMPTPFYVHCIGCEKTAKSASKNGHPAFNSGRRLSRPNENQTAFSIRRV